MIIEKQRRPESHTTNTTEVNENSLTSRIITNSNLPMSTSLSQIEFSSVGPTSNSTKCRTDLSSTTSKSKKKRRS